MLNRQWIILIAVLVFWQAGCTNRCTSPSGCSPFSTARVPAPGTGQLTIPTQVAGQPYYTPGAPGSTTASTTLNPTQSAPTVALNTQPLNGWAPLPPSGYTNSTYPNSGYPTSVYPNSMVGQPPAYSSNFQVAGVPPSGGAPGYRVATGTTMANPATTSSLQDGGTNGTVNQGNRTDPSRLPASDATQVRAPSQVATNPNFAPPTQPASYSSNLQAFQPVVPPQVAGTPGSVPPNYQAQPYNGQPMSYQSPFVRTSPQMAQTPGTSGYGWAPRTGDRVD